MPPLGTFYGDPPTIALSKGAVARADIELASCTSTQSDPYTCRVGLAVHTAPANSFEDSILLSYCGLWSTVTDGTLAASTGVECWDTSGGTAAPAVPAAFQVDALLLSRIRVRTQVTTDGIQTMWELAQPAMPTQYTAGSFLEFNTTQLVHSAALSRLDPSTTQLGVTIVQSVDGAKLNAESKVHSLSFYEPDCASPRALSALVGSPVSLSPGAVSAANSPDIVGVSDRTRVSRAKIQRFA